MHNRRPVLSWVMYDWANSAFATAVMAGFFPVFFKQYWCAGMPATASTLRLGLGNAGAALVIALAAPVLGAIGDRGSSRKRFLVAFASLGLLSTACLFFVAQGFWALAVCIYGLGVMGFAGANVFYDSLLVSVTDARHYDRISALGFAVGYLGGGLLFGLTVWMTQKPQLFGLDGPEQAVRVAFLAVAAWWAVFSIPLVLFVHDPPGRGEPGMVAVREGMKQLFQTARELRRLRPALCFLLAYWLYIDGVNTVIKMAVDYGMSLGFEPGALIKALLLTQFVGFPAALVYGWAGERYGAKRGILIGLVVYSLATGLACRMQTVRSFYVLAVVIGLFQGGVQALSRSFFATLIPRQQAGEFFGLYNMLGKFAAILGPILVGVTASLSGNPRVGIVSIVLLFFGGFLILWQVRPATEAPAPIRTDPPDDA